MRNGFCQLCSLNVKEKDMFMHAEKHLKDQAASYARTNQTPPNTQVKFHESMRVTEAGEQL